MSEHGGIGTESATRWARHAAFRSGVGTAELPGGQPVWVVAGYDAAAALLTDPRLALDKRHSRGGYSGFALPPALDRNLLNMDGDEHRRLRLLAAPAFTARTVAGLHDLITTVVERTLAELDSGTEVDLMAELCVPVPAVVIGDLLGVPRDLHVPLRSAASAMVTFDASSQESALRLFEAVGFLTTTFQELVAARRAAPGSGLISAWATACDDGTVTDDELVSLAFLTMMAGLENTAHLAGNVIAALLSSPDPFVVADWPDRRGPVLERASPVPFAIRRFAVTDIEIGGRTVAAGDTVLLSLFGADSDPGRAGRPSLMFGRGPHYCLGAQITDAVLDAIVTGLFGKHPDIRLATKAAELSYRDSWRSHGLVTLPVLLAGAQ